MNTIDPENVLNIPRKEVPHALGLEQRIIAATGELQTKRGSVGLHRLPKFGFVPLALCGLIVLTVMFSDLLPLQNAPGQLSNTPTLQILKESQDVNEQDINDDMHDLLFMYDDHYFAQL